MPRIVKISDLDEEQKKKWIEQVNNRYQERIENQQLEQQRANELFNQLNPPVETKVKKMETYNTIKRNAMKETGEQIKQQNEIRRQQQEAINNQIKEQANKINSDFNKNYPTTVNIPTENSKKNTSVNLPAVRLATEEERNNFKEANNGEIFKLTNGEVDDRNDIQKKLDNITAPIGNLLLGALQGGQNVVTYTQAAGKFGVKKAGAVLLDHLLNNKEVSESVSDTIVNVLESNNVDFQKMNKEKEIVSNEINFNTKKPTNIASQKLTELAPSLGSNIVNGLVAAENPLAGAALFMTSAGGSYLEEGKKRGMDDDQAFGYATVMGIVEGGSESLISGKMASNILKATTGKELSKAYLNSLKNDLIENFVQEAATTWINEGTANAFGGESDWGNWKKIANDSLQDGIDGVLSALILQGTYSGISSSQIAMNKINNGQQLTQQEIENVIKDLKEKEPEKYKQTINGAISALVEKNEARNQTLSLDNIEQQQTTQNSNKTAQNGTSTQISELLNNKVAPMQNYQYEKTENEKVNKFNENASRFFTNSEKSRNYLEMLKQIIIDKDVDIVFDPNLKDSNGNMANGSYSNGVITINPNSTRAGEFIAIHELTHAIGTNSMRNIIEQYRKSNAEFNKAVNDLLQNYKSNELTDEAMADVAGQLFGNQEFINNLAQTNPNMFKKIYNEIKYLWHQFTGYKNQDQFIQDLQYKWEQAYRSNAKLNETSNYSIAGRKALENIKDNRNLYNQAINMYNEAQKMAKHGDSNKKIIETTGWFKDDTGKLKFSFSDRDMDLIENNFLENKIYNLEDILKHDTLFMFYPQLRNYKVEFKDLNKNRQSKDGKLNGSYSRMDKGIRLDINRANVKEDIEGTLIHEIQHAIQDIEGFTGGTSRKLGKKAYNKSLGEIEARDTANRFNKEKYKKHDLSNIIPESAKLDRNILEKMKDGLYNYLNKIIGGSSNEETNSETKENLDRNRILVESRINENENSNKSSFSIDKTKHSIDENQTDRIAKLNEEFDSNYETRDVLYDERNELQKQYDELTQSEEYKEAYKRLVKMTDMSKVQNSQEYEFVKRAQELKNKINDIQDEIDIATSEMNRLSNAIEKEEKQHRTPEEAIKQAKKALGLTNNFNEAGYMLQDGSLLDFSGRSQGSNAYNQRTMDHREINEFGYDMNEFIDLGNIRLQPESNGFELMREPTEQQYNKLKEYINKSNGEVFIDIYKNGKMGLYDTADYKAGTSTNKIINDLQYYFRNGKFPAKSEFADFRYSKENKNWREYLEKNFKSSGTKTNLNEIKIPIEKKQEVKIPTQEYFENKEKIDLLTDKDYEVLNKIYEKEGKTEILSEKKKANLLEKYANDKFTLKDSFDVLAQKFINKGHYVDKLAERTGNLELKYIYDRNLNSFAEGQYVIGVAQTDNNGKNIGESINDIWKPVEDAKLTKEFSEYLLHKHNIDRSGRGKYIFGKEIGPTESTAIVLQYEKEHPEFVEWAKKIYKFNHNNLMNLKDAGMMIQDDINYIEAMYPYYIAVSRNMEDSLYVGDNDKTGTGSPLKKATGGNSDIQPIKDTMAQQAIRIKRLINQNKLGQELAKTLNNAQVEEGVDISVSPTLLLDMETMVDTDTQGNKYYIYFKDGKQQKLKINDNLYESLKPTEINKIEKTLPFKAIQKVTSIQRSLLTSSNPIFVVTNFFKDFQDGAFNSKYSSKFFKNYGKALNEIINKGKYYQSYMANGGTANTYYDYNEGIKKKSNKFVETIRRVNEYVEMLPRLAEFISTLEDGKSLNEALYNAAEITTNFKRGGEITKALNRNGVNFLNASIQGLDKQFRNFSGQKGAKGFVNLLAKAAIMGITPAILNHILLDDDEDYQDLPESTKDLYYLFKYADGKFIRIPKGRVLSIFGAAARRTLEATQGQEDAFEGLGETIVNQIAPNNPLEDNILAPIVQVKNNKTWYGSDLVSSRLQKELPENQYDETTDEFSKWLGKQLKVSPKKVNYLIDQYSGGIGDVILPMITPQAKQNVLVDKFTTDSVLKNKNVSKFYTTLERQQQIVNDSFSTDEDSIQLKYLNSISSEMSKLYKEKRNIQMSNISNDNKTKQVREIQQQIDGLAEKGLSNYKQVKMNKNSAKIGDQEYYKNGNGTWTLLDSEEKNKVGNLSLDTYSDYKQKVYNETQTKRDSGELSKTQELKTKDKIDILLNSKYSDSQIKNIYETLIKSSKDTEYDIIDNTGINIKEYLRYKQQEFESDKKDDGTTTGKTVSGSKKTKVYNYVNNMDISYNQKLLLLGMQYSLTNTEKTKLANYVNNLNINKQEKLNIFEKLSGFTVYKDGRVTW